MQRGDSAGVDASSASNECVAELPIIKSRCFFESRPDLAHYSDLFKDTMTQCGKSISRDELLRRREKCDGESHLRDKNPSYFDDVVFLDTSVDEETRERRHDYYICFDDDRDTFYSLRGITISASKLADDSFFANGTLAAASVAASARLKKAVNAHLSGRVFESQRDRQMEERRIRAYVSGKIDDLRRASEHHHHHHHNHDTTTVSTRTFYDSALDAELIRIGSTDAAKVFELDDDELYWMFDAQWTNKKWTHARDRGTHAHGQIERYYNNMRPDAEFEAFTRTEQGRKFMEFLRDPAHSRELIFRTEYSVRDQKLGLCGQVDALFRVAGEHDPHVIDLYDWKAIEDLTRDKINKYTFQLMAYKYMIERETNFVVRKIYLVNFSPKPGGTYDKIQVVYDEAKFMKALDKSFARVVGACEGEMARAGKKRSGGGGAAAIHPSEIRGGPSDFKRFASQY